MAASGGRIRTVLGIGGLLGVLSLLSASALADTTDNPIATGAVQVTNDTSPVRSHTSPQMGVDPKTGALVIVESDPNGPRTCNVHISLDDGRSWFAGGSPMVSPFTDCTTLQSEYGPYATLAFTRDGALYIAFVGSEPTTVVHNSVLRSVFLAKSTDDGRTFTTTTVFRAPTDNPNRSANKGPMLAIDPSDSKNVYVGWRMGVFGGPASEKLKSVVAASSDGGSTFAAPVDLTDSNGGDYPSLAVGGDGAVHAVYWRRTYPTPPASAPTPVRPIYYLRSTDHGKTWSRVQLEPGSQLAARPPLIAADPSSSTVYVVWYGTDIVNNASPTWKSTLQIFMRVSHDGGSTWGNRIVLNDDTSRPINHYDPGISIAPNGRVDVAWYDDRNSPDPPLLGNINPEDPGLQDVYYSSSTDHGQTWGPNLRLTDRSIDRSIGIWGNNIESHYNVGIASTNTSVYVAWQDTRNGNPSTQSEDIYTSSLKLPGATVNSALPPADTPVWPFLVVGIVLGMGVTMAITGIVVRGRVRQEQRDALPVGRD